jgi:hypothetical protein
MRNWNLIKEILLRMILIENEKLSLDTIPKTIEEGASNFSHTFDGYKFGGSFKECANISKRVQVSILNRETDNLTLSELRTCLFFHYRALRHGGEPNKERVNNLLNLIRNRVLNNRFE